MLPEKPLIRANAYCHLNIFTKFMFGTHEDASDIFRFILHRLLYVLLTVKTRTSVMHHPVLLNEKKIIYRICTSLQNVAVSTNTVGWLPILPSVKSVGVGWRCGKASATKVGHDPLD